MKRKDVILAVFLLLIALILWLAFSRRTEEGRSVRISVNGELYGSYSLTGNETIEISGEQGINILHIADGKVWMEEADCPDGYCKRQGSIHRAGQTIVCLPHRVVAEVRADGVIEEDEDTVDAIVH